MIKGLDSGVCSEGLGSDGVVHLAVILKSSDPMRELAL